MVGIKVANKFRCILVKECCIWKFGWFSLVTWSVNIDHVFSDVPQIIKSCLQKKILAQHEGKTHNPIGSMYIWYIYLHEWLMFMVIN